jgi:tetratricopeptide (TPR) repeat protein
MVQHQMGHVREAFESYVQALNIARSRGNIQNISTLNFNIATLLARAGAAEKALPFAKEAADIFSRLRSPLATKARAFVVDLEAKVRKGQ